MGRRKPKRVRVSGDRPIDFADDLPELDLFWYDWVELTPAERLRRSWAMRARLPDLEAFQDEKLFPRP